MSADDPRDPRRRPGTSPGLPGLPGDDFGTGEPGLDVLLGLLASDPTPDELGGERAALAMFRGSGPPAAAGRGPAPTPARSRAPRRRPVSRLAAAVTLAAAAGFAAAAYTTNLPMPLQQAANRALGFAGVPRPHHPVRGGARPGGPAVSSPAPGGSASPATSAPPAPGSAGPPPAGTVRLSLSATQSRIPADGNDAFTARLTGTNEPVGGATLTLLELAAGQPGWHPVGSATTGGNGSATVTVSGLATNAAFRLSGPDGSTSQPVLVVVLPPVSARVTVGPHGQMGMVTAASPLASPGDTVMLQVMTGNHWMDVQQRTLDHGRQAGFAVRPSGPGGGPGRGYRVVLMPTAAHGLSVSNTVALPSA
ncbi:MAG TPA: hypothetical protein VHY31_18020 [Streptosporangiaceae bacterium]|nr:hypothetical protein [Streptosporangiaceae bacterium]